MTEKMKTHTLMRFMEYLAQRDIHLVEVGTFDTTQKMWNSKPTKVSDSHKTLIKVALQLERLGKSDIEIEIEKFLKMEELV